jgi:hypothetical protein
MPHLLWPIACYSQQLDCKISKLIPRLIELFVEIALNQMQVKNGFFDTIRFNSIWTEA